MKPPGRMDDEGIYAFSPLPRHGAARAQASSPAPAARRHAAWPWLLAALALLTLAGVLATGWALWSWGGAYGGAGDALQVIIDDVPWHEEAGDGVLGFLGVVFGLGLGAVIVVITVPCLLMVALLLALLAVFVSVGMVVGGVVLAVAVVVAVLLSPLLLAGALLWRLMRPRRRPAATIAP